MIFLQSHVVAVVLVEKTGIAGEETGHRFFKIKELFGSAFFINGTVFLTAKHVSRSARTFEGNGASYGLCQKYEEGKSPLNVIVSGSATNSHHRLTTYDWALGL